MGDFISMTTSAPPAPRSRNRENFKNATCINDIVFMKNCVDAGLKFTQDELRNLLSTACSYKSYGAIYYLLEIGAPYSKEHLNMLIDNINEKKYKKSINVIKKLLQLIPIADINRVDYYRIWANSPDGQRPVSNIFMRLEMNNLMHQPQIKEIFDIFIKAGAEPVLFNSVEYEKHLIQSNIIASQSHKYCECNICLGSDEEYMDDETKKHYDVYRTQHSLKYQEKHKFIIKLIDDHYRKLVEPLDINDCSDIVCKYLFADIDKIDEDYEDEED